MEIEESEGPTKHSQTEDGEDGNMDREYKRIKIERDDSQALTQPSTSDAPPAEQDGDQANDADQSSEQNATQVQDDEDEVWRLYFMSIAFAIQLRKT